MNPQEAAERMFIEICKLKEEKETPEMLEKPAVIKKHKYSRHPEQIRVSFSDGSTAVYDLHIEQPAPIIIENLEIIRKWHTGYQAPEMAEIPERRRRRR